MSQRLIVIYGPTASGKTALSIELAKKYNGEIINVDSRQIYRGLDIGTGKILPHETQGIPHHLLDIIDPTETPSVGWFRDLTAEVIQDIFSRGKTAILCGGTGLYIDAATFSMNIPKVIEDEKYRQELEDFAHTHGNGALWKILHEKDPSYAEELHPNNLHYIVRALEVLKHSGSSKTEFRSEKTLLYPDTIFTTPYIDSPENRAKLYENINLRVEKMFTDGLIEETKAVMKKYGNDAPALNTIGYKESRAYILGEISLQEAIAMVAQKNRNYAKRQIAWNKKYEKWTHEDFSL